MKKYLFIYSLAATILIVFAGAELWGESKRHKANTQALMSQIESYRTAADESVAAVQVLRLRCGEYEELRSADAEKIRQLGLKIRRLESAAKSVVRDEISFVAPLRDTVILRDTVRLTDTVRLFRWQDSWVSVDGEICNDSVRCNISSIDTLRQSVYRVPRRFLFFRFGTKALRQYIVSSNPHSEIVYSEYVDFVR